MAKRKAKDLENDTPQESAVTPKAAKKTKKPSKEPPAAVNRSSTDDEPDLPAKKAKSPIVPPKAETADTPSEGRQYWLMKAEPESRLEKGHDIKFSIDDLASKKEPEPWDGIRAYAARNNLRQMRKNDLAFFYHSSCKVPAIVGVMEIVQEHSPDRTAHDPKAPYYDPSSKPEDPKWSVVHVTFRQKLKTPITLKDLRELQSRKDSPLQNMQMLKLTRLSVSRVGVEEWNFLTSIMKENGDEVAA